MIKPRYAQSSILSDLQEKMVFVGGPRQVGKTTLAQFIGQNEYASSVYLNWDNREDRKAILSGRFPGDAELIIFDEIYKYKKWKNHPKGILFKSMNIIDIYKSR